MRFVAIAAAVILAAGCAVSSTDPNATFSRVRVYSMGPQQFMITCVDSAGICANQASNTCPQGFDVVSNTTNPADFGRMTMIVKCHP